MTSRTPDTRGGLPPVRLKTLCRALFFAAAIFQCACASAQQSQPARPVSTPTRPGTNGSGGGAGKSSTTAAPTRPAAAGKNTVAKSAPARASVNAVSTSAGLPGVKLDGVEYIDLERFAKTLGLTATWIKRQEEILLKRTGLKIEITNDSKEIKVNGIRVFAGAAIRSYKRGLWMSRIDADNLLAPLAAQGKGQKNIPLLRVIAIDAGHGGNDAGTVNSRLRLEEKKFTLDTAQRLKKLLEQQGYKVVMTRTSDKFVELGERPEIAAAAGADLFVSVHFNSAEGVAGIETYRFTPRYQQPLLRTKARKEDELENPGDANGYWSTVAAFKMQQALLGDLKAPDRGFKHDKLAVLRLAPCPAILVEPGFLSNDAEARKIATPAYRQQIAEAIANGIKDYAVTLMAARAR